MHELPKISKTGREIIWFTFYPRKFSYLSENHLMSKNIITSLNENQKKRIFFEDTALGKSFFKYGNNDSIRNQEKISIYKIIYYFTYYRFRKIFFK